MSLQLDGTIRPEQARRLTEHLAHCPRCQAAWAALRRAEGMFSQQPWSEPGSDLAKRVLARLPEHRRAIIPPAPAWTRASSIVVAALFLVLVGTAGAVLLTGAAVGYGEMGALGQSGQNILTAGWSSLRYLGAALGNVLSALWVALRWPWLPIAGGVALVAGGVWGWLWARSGRWRL
jgi:anti-sigma factor RsiW